MYAFFDHRRPIQRLGTVGTRHQDGIFDSVIASYRILDWVRDLRFPSLFRPWQNSKLRSWTTPMRRPEIRIIILLCSLAAKSFQLATRLVSSLACRVSLGKCVGLSQQRPVVGGYCSAPPQMMFPDDLLLGISLLVRFALLIAYLLR